MERKRYKKLTYADRQIIERMSGQGKAVKAIASATGVHIATIYREMQPVKYKPESSPFQNSHPFQNHLLLFLCDSQGWHPVFITVFSRLPASIPWCTARSSTRSSSTL